MPLPMPRPPPTISTFSPVMSNSGMLILFSLCMGYVLFAPYERVRISRHTGGAMAIRSPRWSWAASPEPGLPCWAALPLPCGDTIGEETGPEARYSHMGRTAQHYGHAPLMPLRILVPLPSRARSVLAGAFPPAPGVHYSTGGEHATQVFHRRCVSRGNSNGLFWRHHPGRPPPASL